MARQATHRRTGSLGDGTIPADTLGPVEAAVSPADTLGPVEAVLSLLMRVCTPEAT
jgi:hypothetical protein